MQYCIKTNLVHEDFPHRACPTVILEMQSMTCDVFFCLQLLIGVCEHLCIYMRHIFLHTTVISYWRILGLVLIAFSSTLILDGVASALCFRVQSQVPAKL